MKEQSERLIAGALALAIIGGVAVSTAEAQIVRTIDGSGNNVQNPEWGRAGSELLRLTTVDYADGVSEPAAPFVVSARQISNRMVRQVDRMPSTLEVTDLLWMWGQFIDHDIDLTGSASPTESFDIHVPVSDPFFDPFFTGTVTIPLDRSLYGPQPTPQSPRQQLNEITSFLDGSVVYGSDAVRAAALRLNDGSGKLRTSPGDLLPFNTGGLPNAPSEHAPNMFLAGDVRANEQPGLTALHTLFVREHNFYCDVVQLLYPVGFDEFYYQVAKALVTAELQRITYSEFLPTFLGSEAVPTYTGYDPSVNPSIANSFSTCAYRVGHTMLSSELKRLDALGNEIPEGHLALRDGFFNPSRIIDEGGIEPLLRGAAAQKPQRIDCAVVDDVRNFLFGQPGQGGFDLASLNIQRGRDHGLPRYNQMRIDWGLEPVEAWADITSDTLIQTRMAQCYPNVDMVDAWIGGLAEDHVEGAMVGELFHTILSDQFTRLRDGDRYWYQIYLGGFWLEWVESQTLSEVIKRNTTIGGELAADVFHMPPGN
jgi:hypothetical protein